MPLTVRDLVASPALHLEVVVAGDLAAELAWVHVSELADPTPYLEGGELVLTAGIWRGRDYPAAEFVRALRRRAVVAVGWGLLRDAEADRVGETGRHGEVPPDVVAACRDAGLTLLAVPVRTPFIAVSRWFTEQLAEEREAELRARLEFSRHLLAAGDDVGGRPGESAVVALQRIADLVAREVASAVAVEADGAVLVTAAPGEHPRVPVDPRAWPSHAVGGGAWLRVASPPTSTEGRNRVETALPVVGLVLARRRAVRETERRLAGEALALVMSGQDEAARLRLTSFGLAEGAATAVVVLHLGRGASGEPAVTAVEAGLADRGLRGVVGQRGEQLDVVLQRSSGPGALAEDELEAVGHALVEATGARAAGVSQPVTGLGALRDAVQAGRETAALAARGAVGAVLLQQRAGSHRTLLALHEAEVVGRFSATVLGPLLAYDSAHGTDLVGTVRRWLELDAGWKRCADDLGLHVNTLRQRLERVEELTGRRLERTADRVDLWLALQARPRRG